MIRDKAGHGFLSIERLGLADASEDTCTEHADMAEEFRMLQTDEKRLTSSHGKTCECTALSVGNRSEGLVNEGNDHLRQLFLKALHALYGIAEASTGNRDIAIRHDNKHLLGLPFSNQVIEYIAGLTLECPSRLVFTSPMLEVQYRIASAAF